MKIVLSGVSGLLGTALKKHLQIQGHDLLILVRRPSTADAGYATAQWNPAQGTIDSAALEGADAVVHLGGDNIAHGRWTAGKKRLIRDSRVLSTSLLASTIAGLAKPPGVFVCASAIGYYGIRGDEVLTEASPPGRSFLCQTCCDWESATEPALKAGIRTANLRIGVVLSPDGGALAKMLPPFRFCLGGIVGSGRQWWSWISITDVVGVIEFVLNQSALSGPINAVSPHCVTNREFTQILGSVLRRPTMFPLPSFVVKLLMGEMGEELLLGSTRVTPTKLQQAGYHFAQPELHDALTSLLHQR